MNEFDLLHVIGQAQDSYILDAEITRGTPRRSRPLIRKWAAVLAIILAGFLFFQTPVGAAAAERVKEQFTKLIDLLFPPKDLLIYPEGDPESILHEAQGREPEAATPGFAIYIDPDSYQMTEENGASFIRSLSPTDSNLPPCEIEIREISGTDPSTAAQEAHAEMTLRWESVTEIWTQEKPKGYYFGVSGGSSWNSPVESHYFVSNGNNGSFHIASRYFLEATEGHGTRFATMIQTFTILSPQDPAQYESREEILLEAMRQEVAHTQEQAALLCRELEENPMLTQADMNAISEERYTLWLDVLEKLWSALEQDLSEEGKKDLMAAQMDWSAYKKAETDKITAELGGGSLTATAVYGKGADLLEERAYVLLNTLEGTAPILPRTTLVETDPNVIVSTFTDAYFSRDTQVLQQYCADDYPFRIDAYSETASDISAIYVAKGMDSVIRDMAHRGQLNASVEFRPSAGSDYFVYLTILLEWQDGQWVVTFYGLEG